MLQGHRRIVGTFLEALLVANAYRGELLGLIAIHLILLRVNKLHSNLAGSMEIVLDCLRALNESHTYHRTISLEGATTPTSSRKSWSTAGASPLPRITCTWRRTWTTKHCSPTSAKKRNWIASVIMQPSRGSWLTDRRGQSRVGCPP